MKDLLIAFLSVAILIGSWLVFFSYSENKIETYTETIKEMCIRDSFNGYKFGPP